MRVTEKGQVTVPIEFRQKMGILPNSEVEFVLVGKNLVLRKVANQRDRGRRLISSMRGKAQRKLTTDEIMALTRGE
ncbi:MAG TPA: AbrB/MazE/SpoVT family DNA-binding domain-containing protein [Phycisphaerae bacterium]|nr:AbrB/MazE/SpoVT family DNA-binding domain-containing protein [Phycisphaerae bacterium]